MGTQLHKFCCIFLVQSLTLQHFLIRYVFPPILSVSLPQHSFISIAPLLLSLQTSYLFCRVNASLIISLIQINVENFYFLLLIKSSPAQSIFFISILIHPCQNDSSSHSISQTSPSSLYLFCSTIPSFLHSMLPRCLCTFQYSFTLQRLVTTATLPGLAGALKKMKGQEGNRFMCHLPLWHKHTRACRDACAQMPNTVYTHTLSYLYRHQTHGGGGWWRTWATGKRWKQETLGARIWLYKTQRVISYLASTQSSISFKTT